jgi:hypothetical protein
VVCGIAGLGVLGLLTVPPHYRLKRAVAAYRQELRAKGEKLSIEELIPPQLPLESNGVFEFNAAVARLPRVVPACQPSLMECVGSGRARVAWKQVKLPGNKGTNTWPEIEATIDAGRDALEALQAALAKPALQYDSDYRHGFENLSMTHLAPLKGAAQTLAAAVAADLHRGQTEQAWANLRALSALVAHNHREPLLISQLVRVAIAGIGISASWEALQYPGWTDTQLSEWQTLWAAVDLLEPAEAAFAMERAMAEPTFQQFRQSRAAFMGAVFWGNPSTPISLEDGLGGALRELHNRSTRFISWKWFDSYEEELLLLKGWQVMIETTRLAQAEPSFRRARANLEASFAALKEEHLEATKQSPVCGPTLESMERSYLHWLVRAESQRRLLVTAIALQRYCLRHGKHPPDLKSLVPEFLAEVPLDRIDGQPLRYQLKPDGSFLLYSIGEDAVDQGGDATPAKRDEKPRNWNGRDWVWPAPASAEEVAEAERKKK